MAYRWHVARLHFGSRVLGGDSLGRRAFARFARTTVALVLAFQIPISSALSGPALSGVVTDKATGKPVPNAHVVVSWSGTNILGAFSSGGGCHYVQSTVTDDNGRFSVPAWSKFVPNTILFDYIIGVYHPGYGLVDGEYVGGIGGHSGHAMPGGNKLVLPPFSGTVKQHLEVLARIRTYVRCPEAGADRRNFIDFYQAMNKEIKELLETPEGRALQNQEQEALRNRNPALGPPIDSPLSATLDRAIDSINGARDGELYEPVRQPH
jgi:Carboxypeptidase regulatory-like domain